MRVETWDIIATLKKKKISAKPYNGPVVTAVPGYSLLDEKEPDGEPQPVIAWRIGRSWTLPVTTLGCMVGEHYVVQPDGRVARCFKVYGSDVPVLWQSVVDWKLWLHGRGHHPPRHKSQLTSCRSTFQALTTRKPVHFEKGL